MKHSISDLDKTILNRIQSGFPFVSRPFKFIAIEVGISEREVISSVLRLKNAGIIRRIGGNLVPARLGFVSTLCTAMVPESKLELFSDTVNSFSGVTHNYIRDNDFNVWFTFIAESRRDVEESLKIIEEKTGVEPILNLPATEIFKINAEFNL